MVRVGEALSVSTSSCSSLYDSEAEVLQKMPLEPPKKPKKRLSKQLSMLETKRDIAWERRRRQMLHHLQRKQIIEEGGDIDLTDEDLSELKGSIELGFGFNEEQGQRLTTTLPALDLYFAVTRQVSPVSTPGSSGGSSSSRLTSLGDHSSSFGSPLSDSDGLKVMSPGDNPEQVKTRLRHWAQAVACSVIQHN
ncbi:1-phosphatidylinositol-4,5-bisphosphate phosphodiesterase epsilon-1 [Hirschfeldia incana]|nr:1-phosphatidylinositol-4,5-bisphosphate phosphodiesterase epsilon-1 [Hirschfeldia incana]